MKTFPGWREVGRVMRWARWRGAEIDVKRIHWRGGELISIEHRWRIPGRVYVLAERYGPGKGSGRISLSAEGENVSAEIGDETSVEQALRVLAALDLIGEDLTEVADER